MELLFEKGKHISAPPLKLIFLPTSNDLITNTQAMFVVPKRLFKKAHDRNKLKRRMKEAYRLNKNTFYSNMSGSHLLMAFLYTGKKTEDYSVIYKSVIKLLEKVVKK